DQTSHIRVDQLPKHELTVYPGSFSPWHDGHSACVNKAREHGKVLIIPDKNPEKLLVSENYPLRRYILLCRHIKAATQVGPLFIYPGFIIASKKNPTYFWVEKIKHSFPDIKITLLL